MPMKSQRYCSRSCAKYAMNPKKRYRKLTPERRDEIRRRYPPRPVMKELAKEFNVSQSLISRIVRGQPMYDSYSLSMPLRQEAVRNKATRKRDGLVTESNKTHPEEVDNSLDRKFGKSARFQYNPFLDLSRKTILVLGVLFFSHSLSWCASTQLNSSIQAVSSQTTVLSGTISSLAQHQASLIQRYRLTNAGQCGLFVVGVSTGTAGASIKVPLSFLPSTSPIAGVQADLLISSSFTFTGSAIGPAGTAAGKSIQTSNVNGATRVLIFGLNTAPIGVGVLATLNFSSVATTPKNIYPITLTNMTASDPNGGTSLLCGTSGIIKL